MSGLHVRRIALALLPLLVLLVAGGCASPVPGQGGTSGRRITVTIQFYGPPNSGYYYYFAINRFGAQGVQASNCGPVAVYGPASTAGGYGNGYATGSPGCTPTASPPNYGLTDFVYYHTGQSAANNILGLYHYPAGVDPNSIPGNNPPGVAQVPVSYTLPADPSTTTDTNALTTLQFTLDVSQLVTDTTDPVQKANEAAAIRFLQVNIIATDAVPTNQAYSGPKDTDAMGITTTSQGQSSWLEIDLSQNKIYSDSDSTGLPEIAGDVYPCGNCNDAFDLLHWSIRVNNYGG